MNNVISLDNSIVTQGRNNPAAYDIHQHQAKVRCYTSILNMPSSMENVIKYDIKNDIKNDISFRMIFRLQDWKSALSQAPIMVLMYGSRSFWGEKGHAIVLTKVEDEVLTYFDSWFSEN